MKLEFSGQIFEKFSNVKFRENPSSESGVLPCGQTDTTKLIVAYKWTESGYVRQTQHCLLEL